jgi:hypothetical protein
MVPVGSAARRSELECLAGGRAAAMAVMGPGPPALRASEGSAAARPHHAGACAGPVKWKKIGRRTGASGFFFRRTS